MFIIRRDPSDAYFDLDTITDPEMEYALLDPEWDSEELSTEDEYDARSWGF